MSLENLNPTVYSASANRQASPDDFNDDITDEFDNREVFDILRGINDPEHPLTLEELNVIENSLIEVRTPTISSLPQMP